MTQVEQLARFATEVRFEALSNAAREQLKIRILDALACAIAAWDAAPMRAIRDFIAGLDGGGDCTLIGGGRARADLAAFHNAALVRYLDFNDSYLARGETCHPSDNLGALLAAGEYAGASGRDLMVALAVAYQVQCRLCDVAPVRARGFDHTVQGAYAASAGLGRVLGLATNVLANALAISGTALNALRVTRTGELSNWKGLAYAHMAADCLRNALLADAGISGPPAVIEGAMGLMGTITGPFHLDWGHEDLERVTHTVLKKHNAEIHSQSTLEAALRLRREPDFASDRIARVEVRTFDVAYNIIGGGPAGSRGPVRSKEQADHSLAYLVAAALLDGEVMPEQFRPDRIRRADVQGLMERVTIREEAGYSAAFPTQMPSAITVELQDGRRLEREERAWPGSRAMPMDWEAASAKMTRLTSPFTTPAQRAALLEMVRHLEERTVADLMRLLGELRPLALSIAGGPPERQSAPPAAARARAAHRMRENERRPA